MIRFFLQLSGKPRTMNRILATLGVLLVSISTARAEDFKHKTGFVDKVHKDADGKEHKYVVFIPHDYKGDKEFPVILFLHGSGETKGGSKMPVEVGIGPAIMKREKTFPFITVIPQAEKRPWSAGSYDGNLAIAILDEVCMQYKTDKKRIYLTGLSMGGMGAWSHAIKSPERWAAIVPICGRGDTTAAEMIKDLPCWCFHGDADNAVKVEGSRSMIDAIKKAGGNPKYTEYAGVGHNSWVKAYDTDELYEWMLKQVKK
jgi:predicted peptidase